MAVNNTNDFLSNGTTQFANHSSGDPFFECADFFPGIFLTGFSSFLNVVFILPVNCWILWLARRNVGVLSSDFIILNQSVAEVIGNTSIIIFLFSVIINKKVIILISVYLCCTLIVGRPLFQTVFCVERYLAVVHPLVYLKYMKASRIKMSFVGLVWLIILIHGWFVMDSYPRIPTFYVGVFIVMLVVCTSCSVMILWVLKRPKPGEGNEKEAVYQLKRKAFVAVTVILITLVFGYGTVSCVIVLRDKVPYHTYCSVLGLSWCTLLPNTAVQPYLYLSKIGKLPCIKSH
ncbi:hypothetical protein ABG768_025523 [Culter alburnus]|uniref:G-protein coupled receptors family 1 profile domain-containing protein n=1 Tax=Culter alburnus TaxID=194366 RepID=A0AAW2AEP1_CULAL